MTFSGVHLALIERGSAVLRRQRFGLVLSGGGVYGAFQAGVLDAWLTAGLRPTMFAGTSIGSFNSVMANAGDATELRRFWLSMPRIVEREHLLGLPSQWRACLRAFKTAGAVARQKGRRGVIGSGLAAAAAGTAAGAALGHRLAGPHGALAGGIIGGILAGVGGAFAGHRHWDAAGRRKIAALIREREEEGPIISVGAVDQFRRRLERARLRAPVYVTYTARRRLTPQHLIAIDEEQHFEVIPSAGRFSLVNHHSVVDTTIASMAIPFLFGAKNEVNPTAWLDGGLADNVPAEALVAHVDSGALDYLVVLDVSMNIADFKERMGKTLRRVPTLYVNLARSSGVSTLVDFRRAPQLYRYGLRVGRQLHRRWFAGFDPVTTWHDSPADFPRSHAFRVASS